MPRWHFTALVQNIFFPYSYFLAIQCTKALQNKIDYTGDHDIKQKLGYGDSPSRVLGKECCQGKARGRQRIKGGPKAIGYLPLNKCFKNSFISKACDFFNCIFPLAKRRYRSGLMTTFLIIKFSRDYTKT
jgi:hypothetical protein